MFFVISLKIKVMKLENITKQNQILTPQKALLPKLDEI